MSNLPQDGEVYNPFGRFFAALVPRWAFERVDMSTACAAMLGNLFDCAGRTGFVCMSWRRIGQGMGLKPDQAKRHCYELADKHRLIEILTGIDGQPNVIRFLWRADWVEQRHLRSDTGQQELFPPNVNQYTGELNTKRQAHVPPVKEPASSSSPAPKPAQAQPEAQAAAAAPPGAAGGGASSTHPPHGAKEHHPLAPAASIAHEVNGSGSLPGAVAPVALHGTPGPADKTSRLGAPPPPSEDAGRGGASSSDGVGTGVPSGGGIEAPPFLDPLDPEKTSGERVDPRTRARTHTPEGFTRMAEGEAEKRGSLKAPRPLPSPKAVRSSSMSDAERESLARRILFIYGNLYQHHTGKFFQPRRGDSTNYIGDEAKALGDWDEAIKYWPAEETVNQARIEMHLKDFYAQYLKFDNAFFRERKYAFQFALEDMADYDPPWTRGLAPPTDYRRETERRQEADRREAARRQDDDEVRVPVAPRSPAAAAGPAVEQAPSVKKTRVKGSFPTGLDELLKEQLKIAGARFRSHA